MKPFIFLNNVLPEMTPQRAMIMTAINQAVNFTFDKSLKMPLQEMRHQK